MEEAGIFSFPRRYFVHFAMKHFRTFPANPLSAAESAPSSRTPFMIARFITLFVFFAIRVGI
jgi:hypothetical protein